ncbi:hypothetical protein [Bacillus litorisediminis]|nr:hypothetical protein [Bacillus litorisediminis]
MSNRKEGDFQLSYESDGKMGKQQKLKRESKVENKNKEEEFYFNVTQNSE